MIALEHTYTEEAIHKNFRGAKRLSFNLELLTQQRDILRLEKEAMHFISGRWKPAKDQLYIETRNKCAYCEAPTKVVAHGDVEHFRPKSKYWWLAYCYDNYLISCAVCNEIHKKDVFPTLQAPLDGPAINQLMSDVDLKALARLLTCDPLHETQGMPRIQLLDEWRSEEPLLINPYLCDPELYFAYEVDDLLQEVYVIPLSDEVAPCVTASIDVYGLNRVELLSLRYYFYKIYDTNRLTLTDTDIQASTRLRTEELIDWMKQAKAPFAGMVRYFDRILRIN